MLRDKKYLETIAMDKQYTSVLNNNSGVHSIDKYSDFCPYCQVNVHIDNYESASLLDNSSLHVAVKCPKCKKLFVTLYNEASKQAPDRTGYGNRQFHFKYHFVGDAQPEIKTKEYPEIINKKFPKVVDILNESEKAKKLNLLKIAGMGYRKALEFLMKEYVISCSPRSDTDIEKIKEMFLSNVISGYIENANIKELARRASWLGNDESHYERIWQEKDLNDLIALVNLTISYVSMELTGKQYIESMPDKK